MSKNSRIYFTEKDYEVLDGIIEQYPDWRHIEFLEGELERAEVVPEETLPENVVSLHSKVRVRDEVTGEERELTIVPPGISVAKEGQVSVLSPLGAAIIGLAEGQAIDWPMPSGRKRRFRVTQVLYQPEAAKRSESIPLQAA